MNDVSILTCAAGAAWEPRILRELQRRALGVTVVRRCVDHGELLGIALRDRPRAVVVDASVPWIDRDFVASLREHAVAVVIVGTAAHGAAIGARALPGDVDADTFAAVLCGLGRMERVACDDADSTENVDVPTGLLVAVWGGPGSPGRTTVAAHLAVEGARTGQRTLLIDGDAWAASTAQLLGLEESPSVARAANLAAHGWSEPLASCLQAGPDGLSLLAGLPRAALWPEIRPEAWRAVLTAARAEFDLVVLDVAAAIEEDEDLVVDHLPHRRNLMTTVGIDEADEVLLVVAGDPVGLRRGILAYADLAARRGEPRPLVTVAVNRAPRSARRLQDCSRTLAEWTGTAPRALFPTEPAFDRVVWEARPLHTVAPRSRWLRELRELLQGFAG